MTLRLEGGLALSLCPRIAVVDRPATGLSGVGTGAKRGEGCVGDRADAACEAVSA